MADKKEIINALNDSKGKIAMFVDGFIDEACEIVATRSSLTEYTLFNKMNQFADYIKKSGSGGVGLELIYKRSVFGGFTANIGYAAARLGVGCAMVGTYGKDKIDPIFAEVDELCELYSLDDSALTSVYEFDDGKLLMSQMHNVQNITWQQVVDFMGIDKIQALLAEADIVGVGYWSLVPAFDEIFEGVVENMPKDGKTRRMFFDFADFRKKDEASLDYSLSLLVKYNEQFPMSLSVNEHEGATLFARYGKTLDDKGGDSEKIKADTEYVRDKMGLDELIIHTPHFGAVAACGKEPAFLPSVYVEKPVRSAGAGDNFNGGYIAASLAGLDMETRLKVANATVGHFLRTAVFPTVDDLEL